MFLRSIPTSRVTPSPNLRLDAATLKHIGTELNDKLVPKYLESVFLFHWHVHRCGEFPQLVECRRGSMGRRSATMTWTRGVLGRVNETNDGVSGGSHRHRLLQRVPRMTRDTCGPSFVLDTRHSFYSLPDETTGPFLNGLGWHFYGNKHPSSAVHTVHTVQFPSTQWGCCGFRLESSGPRCFLVYKLYTIIKVAFDSRLAAAALLNIPHSDVQDLIYIANVGLERVCLFVFNSI